MTLEIMVLITQAASVFFLAAWLTIGVFENLFYADMNRAFTTEVLDFTRMRQDYPEAYARVAHRRVTNLAAQKWVFRLIVGWEIFTVLALWGASSALLLAALGCVSAELARALGLFAALSFTSTWAGFLIVGNWFCYWFCHEGAQNTHYQMTLWGIVTMILLAVR